ncbi:MAG: transcriptional repressor LexA [Gammaproteobacteria bacterium]
MSQLTRRQQEILDWIAAYQNRYGATPSRSEIASALKLRSARTVEGHLRRLAAKGMLALLPGRNRNIRLLARPDPAVSESVQGLPVIGRVAAGSPILAVENIETHISTVALFSPPAHFLLRVQGDSMIQAGIEDGDLLAVHKTADVQDGQIVIARLDDEVTVGWNGVGSVSVYCSRILRMRRSTLISYSVILGGIAIEGRAVGVIRAIR